jgi:hypothetical protein
MDRDGNFDVEGMNETIPEETTIDLNTLFCQEGRDLNRLFPDPPFKRFLRDVSKNQRDVERFLKRLENGG